MLLAALLLAVQVWASGAGAQEAEADRRPDILKGLPKDILDAADRAEACVHWQGEHPYDKERKADIERALRQLRCSRLPDDIAALSRKHKQSQASLDGLGYIAMNDFPVGLDLASRVGLMTGMPPDVEDLISRSDQCAAYWRGRGHPKLKPLAMQNLRCSELRADFAWLTEQYTSSAPVSAVLKRVEEKYLK